MTDSNPATVTSASGERTFAAFPAAVLVVVVNDLEQILLLSHPDRPGKWEVVNGGLEAGESVWDGALRECAEELGAEATVRPVSALHAMTVAYDDAIPNMISLVFVAAYEGGEVNPGDDMAGSSHQWANISDLLAGKIDVIVPRGQPWLFRRAVDAYRLWRGEDVELQIPVTAPHK